MRRRTWIFTARMLISDTSSDRGEGFRACGNPHQETGTPCLGRTPCRLQYGQQVVSDLQCIDKKCTREQERHLHRDTFGLPEPDLVSGFDEGEFTYDEHDDMVRDVRNYTSNLDPASPHAADGVVGDPSVRDLLEQIRAITTRDLGLNPASSVPSEHPPVGHSPIASPGGVSPASREGCLLYTSPSPRDLSTSRMPSSA